MSYSAQSLGRDFFSFFASFLKELDVYKRQDTKKADEKAIEEIACVKGTFTQAGQFQVIIGNDVAIFYNEFTKYAGVEGGKMCIRDRSWPAEPSV